MNPLERERGNEKLVDCLLKWLHNTSYLKTKSGHKLTKKRINKEEGELRVETERDSS